MRRKQKYWPVCAAVLLSAELAACGGASTQSISSESEKPVSVSDSVNTETKASSGEPTVMEYFQNPDSDAKPMARMWFPDAGAGADDNDTIEKQIQELADKGFGGVEVAMLADGVDYTNEDSVTYGWGTQNWCNLLKKVLKAAAKVEGGFEVDCTITAHWPPSLDTIDPNDDAASKELSYSFTKVTSDDLQSNALTLTLPEQKVEAPAGGFGGGSPYPGFLFTDTFISATLVQVSDVEVSTDEETGETTSVPVLDYSTVTPVTEYVSEDKENGYAAGVPDRETAEKYGWDYNEILETFGPEPEGELVNNNGKADAEGNRARMADWQNAYVINASAMPQPDSVNTSDGEELEAGDWVILSTFYRGTGQCFSGASASNGNLMSNLCFVTSYYNEEGTSAVTGYWDQMFSSDPELLELMKENPGYIFEDSIESSSVSSYWAAGLQEDAADLEYADILSLVAAGRYTGSGFGGSTLTEFYKFSNDDGLTDRIYEDYNALLADSYVKYRVNGVRNWAEETMGWGFRGQTYQLPGLEISQGASVADVPECDNMSKGDGIRYQSGTSNISNKNFLTMEAITGPMQEYVTMDDVLTELGQNYSDGVNRAILHGSPYAKTFNGYNSEWPGWLAFGAGSFGSSYTYREAFWEDFGTETSYMSRIQAVLQKGTAQIDLAVLIDKEHTFDFESGNHFQNLLDAGYSYNLISEANLGDSNALVENGVLAPDGPAYKALIVDEVTIFDVESMDKLITYAKNGLPIIVYKSNVSRVYGSKTDDDAVLQGKYQELLGMDNVIQADNEDALADALTADAILPYAQYSHAQLETTMYTDPVTGSNFYYMYNNAYPENTGMMGNDQASEYKGEDKIIRDIDITLEGTGKAYVLDPHTGSVCEAADQTVNEDGTITVHLQELYGGDSVFYCVTEDTTDFPENVETEKVVNLDTDVEPLDLTDADWNLLIHSYGPGNDENDPSVSKVTDVDFGSQKLVNWAGIKVTDEQLTALGVDDMKYVSGIGEYTTEFELPDDFDPDTMGAYLDVTYGKDQIGSITINGTSLSANNVSDRTDLSGYLVAGKNTLTIKLSTTLYARMYKENSGYANAEFGMGSGFMQPVEEGLFCNGLQTVTITPYATE